MDLAFDAGADCVKFQMRNMSSLYSADAHAGVSSDLGAEYTMDLLKKFQLTNTELMSVFDYCKSKGLMPSLYAMGSREFVGSRRLRNGGLQGCVGRSYES